MHVVPLHSAEMQAWQIAAHSRGRQGHREALSRAEIVQPRAVAQADACVQPQQLVLGADGEEVQLMSFIEALPHHVRFVKWCVKDWQPFRRLL